MRRIAFAAFFLIAWFGGMRAQAQNCTATLGALSFGTYTGALLNVNSAAGSVRCNGAWSLGLNAGNGTGATTTTRKMQGPGGALLNYRLFQDTARTVNWGDTQGTDTLTGSGNTSPIYVYGQIAANQYLAPGNYTDTISSATTQFTVTAVIQATCLIGASALAFGNYSGVLKNVNSTITVTCTNTTAYNIGLNAGTATGATVTNRSMTGPSATLLPYALFSDTNHTKNWGNTAGTNWVSGTGNGTPQALTVYGQIPAGKYVRPGSYSDTITATITY